jgi:hypothetical protein
MVSLMRAVVASVPVSGAMPTDRKNRFEKMR